MAMCLVVRGMCDGYPLRTNILGEGISVSSVCDLQSTPQDFTCLFYERRSDSPSSFGLPRNKQVLDFFLDAKYFFCLVNTNRHQRKEFHFYFYHLSFGLTCFSLFPVSSCISALSASGKGGRGIFVSKRPCARFPPVQNMIEFLSKREREREFEN